MVRFTLWIWIAKTEYQIDIFLPEKFLKIGHFQFYGTFLRLKLKNNEKMSLLLNFFILNHCLCKIKNSTQRLIPACLSRTYFRMLWRHCNNKKTSMWNFDDSPTILFLKNIFDHGNVHLYIMEYINLFRVTVPFKIKG